MSKTLHRMCSRAPQTAVFVALCLAVVALYYRAPSFGYYFDDEKIIDASHQSFFAVIALPGNEANPIPQYYYRPVAFAMFWIYTKAGIESPAAQYVTNILLHILAVLLVLRLILQFHPDSGKRGAGVAGLWALVFATGFIAAYSMTWIAQRFDLLAAVCALSALYAARAYWAGGSPLSAAAALVAGMFAMLSKETGYLLPLLLPAWYAFDTVAHRERDFRFRRAAFLTAAAAASVAGVLILRAQAGTASAAAFIDGQHVTRHIVTYARAILELLQPVRSISLLGVVEGGARPALFATAVLTGLPLALWAWALLQNGKRQSRVLAAGLLPALLSLGMFGIMGWVHPRLLYLPFALLCIALGITALRSAGSRRWAALPVVLLAAFGAVVSTGIVTRFQNMDGFNRRAAQTLGVSAPDSGYFVLSQQATRFLHGKHGGRLIAALHSETDPVFMSFLHTGGAALFTYRWTDDTTLLVTSATANTFFILAPDAPGATQPPGDPEFCPGCTVSVTRTALGGRPVEIAVRFNSAWLESNTVFIDNGEAVKRLGR